MIRSRLHWKLPPFWQVWLAALCVVLVLFSATVQVAHAHTDGRVHSDCVLCHVAQKSAQSPSSQAATHILHPVARVIAASPSLSCKHHFAFSLWDRPPPTGLDFVQYA